MRKNPLTMELVLAREPKSEEHLVAFRTRLEAKMEGKLHAKEDTYTLSYYILEGIRRKMLGWLLDVFPFELSYTAATALAYELKTYPSRPSVGILTDILAQLDQGLREKKQHDRERKRTAKQRDRPTVRNARGLQS